jgi:hypothetical protein
MAKLTINEGLIWLKALKQRHGELVGLRNDNAHRETRWLGAHADKSVERTPVYDVRALDALVGRVAREIRLLETAIKRTNAATIVEGYEQDDAVLGEVQ